MKKFLLLASLLLCLNSSLGYSVTGQYLNMHKAVSGASTNSTSVKGSKGSVCSLYMSNINAAPAYVKFYDKATAPTCNSDTVKQTYLIPGSATGAGAIYNNVDCLLFTAGIGYCITTGAADNNNTGVAAAEVIVNIGYK